MMLDEMCVREAAVSSASGSGGCRTLALPRAGRRVARNASAIDDCVGADDRQIALIPLDIRGAAAQ
jgi:hypothetical protein